MSPQSRRPSLPTSATLAALAGTVIGCVGLAVCAWLAHAGFGHTASLLGETLLLVALAGVAAAVVVTPPTRLRRARVPISRAVPHQWWPPQNDPTPLLAACIGAPVALGATAAVVLFH